MARNPHSGHRQRQRCSDSSVLRLLPTSKYDTKSMRSDFAGNPPFRHHLSISAFKSSSYTAFSWTTSMNGLHVKCLLSGWGCNPSLTLAPLCKIRHWRAGKGLSVLQELWTLLPFFVPNLIFSSWFMLTFIQAKISNFILVGLGWSSFYFRR